MTAPSLLPLPRMRTYEEAVLVSKKKGDQFFLCAFILKDWICNLMSDTFLAYKTCDKRPCAVLQDGQAFSGFCQLFPEEKHLQHALSILLRFTQYDNRFANSLRRAHFALRIEEQLPGRPSRPQPRHSL